MSKDEEVYQFDTLMKELSTGLDEEVLNQQGVRFVCDSPPEEEDEETAIKSIKNDKTDATTLPSINSLIGQQSRNQMKERVVDTNADMEWNDTEFLKLCEELDDTSHLFANKMNSDLTKSFKPHHTNHFQPDDTIYAVENHCSQMNLYNTNQNGLKLPIISNPTDIIYDENHQNVLSFNSADQIQSLHGNVDFNLIQNQHNSVNPSGNANMLMQWEFDNDFTQIANYLQSPTV